MNSSEFSDVVLKVQGTGGAAQPNRSGTSIHCHKVILSRCLKTYIKDNGELQRLKIRNFGKQTVLDFCEYLYTGKVTDDEERVKDLLHFAHTYGLPFLRQLCEYQLINRGKNMPRASTLNTHLGSALDSGQFYDCTFEVEGKRFKLHSFVLANRCAQLKKLVEAVQDKDTPVPFGSVSKGTFKAILQYIYTDTVQTTQMEAEEIVLMWKAAKELELPDLAKKCEFFLVEKISNGTVAELLQASEVGMPILRKACTFYIAKDIKSLKGGSLDTLAPIQVNEVKKLHKEIKKEQDTEDKEKRKTLKKQRLGKGAAFPPPAPTSTPGTFFAKRIPLESRAKQFGKKPLNRRNSTAY